MLSEVGAFRMQNSFANLVNKILQFPINFQNQKIKWKGSFQLVNYQVIKEYTFLLNDITNLKQNWKLKDLDNTESKCYIL